MQVEIGKYTLYMTVNKYIEFSEKIIETVLLQMLDIVFYCADI